MSAKEIEKYINQIDSESAQTRQHFLSKVRKPNRFWIRSNAPTFLIKSTSTKSILSQPKRASIFYQKYVNRIDSGSAQTRQHF
jgi:hypothetical protein